MTPGAEGDTIATITTGAPLPTDFAFSATINARTVADFKQNGMLIFDYQSPTDFKFVSMHAGGDKWRIGSGMQPAGTYLAEREKEIGADTDVRMSIEVYGTAVVFRCAGRQVPV